MVKRVRQDWLELAREMLINGGLEAVTVQSMSRRLGVTRGGFYGYFSSRDALLQRLLKDWQDVNTAALRRIAARDRKDGEAQFKELVEMWVEDEDYSPQYDSAVRDWARRSPQIARKVRKVDDERIGLIEKIFWNLGFTGLKAHTRAHHLLPPGSHYALAVHETRPARRRLLPRYAWVLAERRTSRRSVRPQV